MAEDIAETVGEEIAEFIAEEVTEIMGEEHHGDAGGVGCSTAADDILVYTVMGKSVWIPRVNIVAEEIVLL
jgi:hypothetical protein